MDDIFTRVLLSRPDLGVLMMMSMARALDANGFARFMLGTATLTDWTRVIFAMPKLPFIKQALGL
jgi:lycopene beta-cyclase